jgi:hypothetical protein
VTCAGPVCPRGSNYLRCADRRTHCPPGAGLRSRTSNDKLERIRRVRSPTFARWKSLPDELAPIMDLCRSCPLSLAASGSGMFYNPNLIHLTDNPV